MYYVVVSAQFFNNVRLIIKYKLYQIIGLASIKIKSKAYFVVKTENDN